jgi:RecB family endonuclease NucS
VDILAKDKAGIPVVIELKVSRGHERTIGQALYYRAKVKEIFNVERVRIFIVALEMSLELRSAAKEVLDVSLFEYSLSMTVKRL